MRKTFMFVVILAVIGMVGWSAYDFLSSDDTESSQDDFDDGMINNDEGEDASANLGLEEGKQAPDFELETLDGDKAKLSDYEGERVIVNFWATWCPPCREEIPDLKQLYDEEDVEILAVNMTSNETSDMDDIEEFVNDEFEMPFPVLLDYDDDVRQTYKVVAYPTSYMLDSETKIQITKIGEMTYNQMKKEMDKNDYKVRVHQNFGGRELSALIQ